jgi:hypothetical protein
MEQTPWPLRDDKSRLSELVDKAKAGTPQIITAQEQDLVSFLRGSPLVGVDLQIERDDDPGRPVAL